MNIVHVIEHLHTGGEENLIVSLVEALQNLLAPDASQCLVVLKGGTAPLERAVRLGLPVVDLSGASKVAMFRRLRQLFVRRRPDIVHTRLSSAGYWGRLAALTLPRRPVLLHAHGGQTFGDAGLKRKILENLLDRFTARHICVSESVRAHLRECGFAPAKLVVIPNGVSVDLPARDMGRPLPLERPLRLVCLGRLERVKGQDVLLDALACTPKDDIPEGRRDFVLDIVGGGSEEQALREQAERIGTGRNGIGQVRILGNVAEFSRKLHEYDLFLLPSRSEGLSLALLEAMTVGLPIIATDTGENRTVLDGFGTIVPGEDPDALARAVTLYLQFPEKALERAEGSRRRVEAEYGIGRTAKRYLQLFQQVCPAASGVSGAPGSGGQGRTKDA
jgi:glycosyltransferase involved in cell wall biosynthesis